jgi:hypothetical protein
MVNSSQISEHMAAYLNGRTDVDVFEDWIIANTWNVHLTGDSEAMELAYEIKEFLNEYSSLHIRETQLKENLKRILYSIKPRNVIEVDLARPVRTVSNGWTTTAQSAAADSPSIWDRPSNIAQV